LSLAAFTGSGCFGLSLPMGGVTVRTGSRVR
jgi:hypothetical protein